MDPNLERLKQMIIKMHRQQEMRVMPGGYPQIEVFFSQLLQPTEVRKWEVTPRKIVVKWNLKYLTDRLEGALERGEPPIYVEEIRAEIEKETREALARIRSLRRH